MWTVKLLDKFKIGILRVLTTDNSEVLFSHEKILGEMFPQFELKTKCIPNQYEGIHDEKTYNDAVPKIIKMAVEWENEIDGLIISCAGDPALEILREKLKIPVVGGGHSAAVLSINYGKKIGIIGIEDKPPKAYLEILQEKLIGYELSKGINNTNDLRTDAGRNAIRKSAYKLIEKGADAICFACTGLSTINAKEILQDLDVPIIDAVIAEGTIMLSACLLGR